MMRELERDHRIVSFRLTILDRPGMLGRISTLLGKLGAIGIAEGAADGRRLHHHHERDDQGERQERPEIRPGQGEAGPGRQALRQ